MLLNKLTSLFPLFSLESQMGIESGFDAELGSGVGLQQGVPERGHLCTHGHGNTGKMTLSSQKLKCSLFTKNGGRTQGEQKPY